MCIRDSIIALAKVLGVTTDALLLGREEPQPPQEPKSPAGYLLRSYEGRLAVFRQGCDTPELIFDVYTRLLDVYKRQPLPRNLFLLPRRHRTGYRHHPAAGIPEEGADR